MTRIVGKYLVNKRTLVAFLTGGALLEGGCSGATAALDGTASLLQFIGAFL